MKLTYKYYPVVDIATSRGEGESHWSAYAAECANQQGKFWEYHDKLFSVWAGENVGTFTKDKLKGYAVGIVPDTATFNTCLDQNKTASVIDADQAEATRMGVQGTPTFFLNSRLLQVNPTDYGAFQRTFDSIAK